MALFTVVTELLIDGVWTDISSDVRLGDAPQITRGRADEASQADPSSCTLTINNRDGKYSPRNPEGPYYGLIGRNTPIRVTANGSTRFCGEVAAWPQRWDKTGRDRYVPVQAFGVLRRLGQGQAPFRSVMYRALTSSANLVAYWPCEDPEGAQDFGSALDSGTAMVHPSGETENATYDAFSNSDPLPLASGVYWSGQVRPYIAGSKTQVRFLMHVPGGGLASTGTVCRVWSTGTAPEWVLEVTTSGQLVLRAYDGEHVQVLSSGFLSHGVNGLLLQVSIELEQSGSNVAWAVRTTICGRLGVGDTTSSTGTLNSRTFGRCSRVEMNVAGSTMTDTALGHISVHNDITSITLAERVRLAAYLGETAADRITRLCGEQNVPVTIIGTPADSTPLGVQTSGTFLDLLREAAEADMGVLYEPRDSVGLVYRTRASMYAQDAALTLDYGAGTVWGIEPTEDDDTTRNDVTVVRANGSSSRAQLTTGPLSILAPPDGVGRYDEEVTVSLQADTDTRDQASWRLHMGTVDEARYPVLGVNLAVPAFTSDAGLTADAVGLDVGDRIVVTGAPEESTSPDDIQQIAQGFTESLGQYEWTIDVNCAPASPYDIAVWDDSSGPGEARYSSDGTTLTSAVAASGCALNLTGGSGGRAEAALTGADAITGDIDIRAYVAMTDWTPSATQEIVTRYVTSGNQRSWRLAVNSTGNLVFIWSTTGSGTLTRTSTSPVGASDGTALWVRVTLDVDNGAAGHTVTFYTSSDGVSWSALGSPVVTAGVSSIFNGSAPTAVGSYDAGTGAGRLVGKVAAVQVRDGIGGTAVLDARFDAQAEGAAAFTDAAGRSWSVTSPASIAAVANTVFPGVLEISTPSGPVWSDADAPYDVVVGGERMTVVDVAGSSAAQTVQVLRCVNGVRKGHAAGATFGLFKPGVYAL